MIIYYYYLLKMTYFSCDTAPLTQNRLQASDLHRNKISEIASPVPPWKNLLQKSYSNIK